MPRRGPFSEIARSTDSRAGANAGVGGDVESGQLLAVGLRNDQGQIVGRYGHAVGEGDAVGHLPKQAIERQHGDSGATLDIDIPAAVHDYLVPAHAGRTMQVGMGQVVEGEVGEISFPSALIVDSIRGVSSYAPPFSPRGKRGSLNGSTKR